MSQATWGQVTIDFFLPVSEERSRGHNEDRPLGFGGLLRQLGLEPGEERDRLECFAEPLFVGVQDARET